MCTGCLCFNDVHLGLSHSIVLVLRIALFRRLDWSIATYIGWVDCLLFSSMSAKKLIKKNLEFYVCSGIKIKNSMKF